MSASSSVWLWCDWQRIAGALCQEGARRPVRGTILGHRRCYEQRQAGLTIGLVPGMDLARALLEIMH